MKAYERLLKYVKIHTSSNPDSDSVPSDGREFTLANILLDELKEMGVSNSYVDDKCYLYGFIPATKGYEKCPAIGFIAHMDTAPDFNGKDVNPLVIEAYDGSPIILGNSGKTLTKEKFPELNTFIGRRVITTDGTSLLGADDKAGISEIMTAIEEIITEDIPHGKVCIAFTPDEEIGRGADCFDVKNFGADYAYTVDGGAENEVEYENFNAAGAKVNFTGVNVHPGSAKDKMINASLLAMEFNEKLPANEIPGKTANKEGFFHLTDMSGSVEKATLEYIIRDHDEVIFKNRKEKMLSLARELNDKYGEGAVEVIITDQYQNMLEMIKPHMHLIDNAFTAIKAAGEKPIAVPIRGGTDGARLSFMGLPCPNLGTGGYDFHGPLEHISAEGMDTVVRVIRNIIELYAKK